MLNLALRTINKQTLVNSSILLIFKKMFSLLEKFITIINKLFILLILNYIKNIFKLVNFINSNM